MSGHFVIRCLTCRSNSPVAATTREEMERADIGESLREEGLESMARTFEQWIEEHGEHKTEVREV